MASPATALLLWTVLTSSTSAIIFRWAAFVICVVLRWPQVVSAALFCLLCKSLSLCHPDNSVCCYLVITNPTVWSSTYLHQLYFSLITFYNSQILSGSASSKSKPHSYFQRNVNAHLHTRIWPCTKQLYVCAYNNTHMHTPHTTVLCASPHTI